MSALHYRTYERRMRQTYRNTAAERQGWLCHWCGKPMLKDASSRHPQFCTADHLVPQARGGITSAKNIVAACRDCNNRRKP